MYRLLEEYLRKHINVSDRQITAFSSRLKSKKNKARKDFIGSRKYMQAHLFC